MRPEIGLTRRVALSSVCPAPIPCRVWRGDLVKMFSGLDDIASIRTAKTGPGGLLSAAPGLSGNPMASREQQLFLYRAIEMICRSIWQVRFLNEKDG
jgi:hypothetical protein